MSRDSLLLQSIFCRGRTAHECPIKGSQSDVYSHLLATQAQPRSQRHWAHSLRPFGPHRTGNIQTGQEAGAEATSLTYSSRRLVAENTSILQMQKLGLRELHRAQSHPASEGLSEDLNLQEMVFKGAGPTPGPGIG